MELYFQGVELILNMTKFTVQVVYVKMAQKDKPSLPVMKDHYCFKYLLNTTKYQRYSIGKLLNDLKKKLNK